MTSRISQVLPALLLCVLSACNQDTTTPPESPGVEVATASQSLSIGAGGHASLAVHVTRTGGFGGPITLGISGAPAHVTATVASNPVAGDNAVIDFRVDDDVAPGSYALTLTATGSGLDIEAVRFELNVESTAPGLVTVAYCAARSPIWVAFQDGDDAWVRATAITNNGKTQFGHEFTSPRGAVATLTRIPNSTKTILRVLFGVPAQLAAEGDTLSIDCDATARTWRGSVAGLTANEKVLVSTGQRFLRSVLPFAPEFELVGVPAGPQDVLGSRVTPGTGGIDISGFILRRRIDAADATVLESLDFSSPEVFAPATATLTVLGAGNDAVSSFPGLLTANSILLQPSATEPGSPTVRRYAGVPSNHLMSGDLQFLHVSSSVSNGSSRTADVYFRSVADRAVRLGARITPPSLGFEEGDGPLRPRAAFGRYPDYDQSTSIIYMQEGLSSLVSISMTAAYPLPDGALQLDIPDFRGVEGFDVNWGLREGIDVRWEVNLVGGTVPLDRSRRPVAGAERRTASLHGLLPVR